jgi:hypothetical protein
MLLEVHGNMTPRARHSRSRTDAMLLPDNDRRLDR